MFKMTRQVWPVIAVALGLMYLGPIAGAQRTAVPEQFVGSWRVVSYELEFQDGGERVHPLGSRPNGYVILGADGRMMSYLEAANRKPPRNDQERAEAYRTMNAYTGRYRVEGNQWVTKVDAAWNVEWVGVEQARSFTLSGDQLNVATQWNVNQLYEGRIARGHLTFARER